MEDEMPLKILIIGDQAVGKTSFIFRFCDDVFISTYICTIGVNYKSKMLEIGSKQIKLNIFDPTGQERFRSVPRAFYAKADGILLSYDCTDINSYHNISEWVEEINRHTDDKIPKVLIATKCDLEEKKVVNREQGQSLASSLNIQLFETSAKNNINVSEPFYELGRHILQKPQNRSYSKIKVNKNKNKSKCC